MANKKSTKDQLNQLIEIAKGLGIPSPETLSEENLLAEIKRVEDSKQEEKTTLAKPEVAEPPVAKKPAGYTPTEHTFAEYAAYVDEHGKLTGTMLKDYIAQNKRLIRCKIMVLDRDLQGLKGRHHVLINDYIQAVQFVPYESSSYSNGYHLMRGIVDQLNDTYFLKYSDVDPEKPSMTTLGVSGIDRDIGKDLSVPYSDLKLAHSFSIEKLPDLTPQEFQLLLGSDRSLTNQYEYRTTF